MGRAGRGGRREQCEGERQSVCGRASVGPATESERGCQVSERFFFLLVGERVWDVEDGCGKSPAEERERGKERERKVLTTAKV
jgi:hypothetical protein